MWLQELEVRSPRLWSPAVIPTCIVWIARSSTGLASAMWRASASASVGSPSTTRASPSTASASSCAGTNRHQEHPYIGYALPDAAQYRDARRIKEAGFDFVRLSHYPHSPAFMDACDELGLVVMDCIPGWQYFNPDPAFVELQYRNCRELIRRDRNHPCVILWEVSLNESAMPPEFVARAHAIAHEEYPGDQCFTAGWTAGYDVFLQARQHGGCRDGRHRPCAVSEYGDWEYYAMNAGLDQTAWTDLTPAESNSRQLRWQGERALLQQATNFQEAHNDNLGTIAFADGLWVMYDYNRGYAPDVESSGCMDLFRLPKFSYHFFRSQRPPAAGPVVFIASHWMPGSAEEVRVFSNCEEVALSLDGRLLERRRPDRDRIATRLAHPPFTFRDRWLPARQAGGGGLRRWTTGGQACRAHAGPDRAADARGGPRRVVPSTGVNVTSSSATRALRDAQGTMVPDAWENVAFGVVGDARPRRDGIPYSSEAGIASIVADVQSRAGRRSAVYGLAIVIRRGRGASARCVPRTARGGAPARAGVSPPTGQSRARAHPLPWARRGDSRLARGSGGAGKAGSLTGGGGGQVPHPRHRATGEAGAIPSVSHASRAATDLVLGFRYPRARSLAALGMTAELSPVPYPASPARASPARTRGAPAPTTGSR